MKNHHKPSVGIIGAGPAGLTAALELTRKGCRVEVFEASAEVGGLCKTIDLWGQKVDLGPHRFFSSDPRVNGVWLEMAGDDYRLVDRLTRILYRGQFFHYPLRVGNVLRNLGPWEALRCVFSYLREKAIPRTNEGSFEDWVTSRFGRRLYQIFFKTYSEKLWGISGQELDEDFAAQRIKKLSFLEAVKNALLQGRGNKHKTLVDQFAYPTAGTGLIYDRMADSVEARGGSVHLSTPVRRVLLDEGRAVGLEVDELGRREFDHIISSMPLTLMVRALPNLPPSVAQACDNLRFRNTVLVYLLVDRPSLFQDNWLYVHSPEVRCGRITNFRNWVPDLYGAEQRTILALEYWCNGDEPEWEREDSQWRRVAEEDFHQTGLSNGAVVLDHEVVRINRCYPIYERGYNDHVAHIRRYLDTIDGLQVIGRYGSFKYNNQDHSILMGLLAAENALGNETHDLWRVNTDYEYQEKALITKTGLTVVETN